MAAENDLASVRSSLLLVAQTGDSSDLAVPRRNLARLAVEAGAIEMPAVVRFCAECEESIASFAINEKISPGAVYAVLDIVARIEAAVWDVPIQSGDFLSDISGFVDASFDELMPRKEEVADTSAEEFEIDEETLDIFRSEADDLLSNIAENLSVLSASPAHQTALWEVRRNAHTFKGAAGIVGLTEASAVAHRMEDLLDKMVELRSEAAPQVMAYLLASSRRLTAITGATDFEQNDDLDQKYSEAMAWLSTSTSAGGKAASSPDASGVQMSHVANTAVRAATTPIVRVSLDRLDELIKMSRSLIVNRSTLTEGIAKLGLTPGFPPETLAQLGSLFAAQKTLIDDIQAKLLKIRMVKFATLETRLSRNVHVTCIDEGKQARLEIENGEVEIDTQVIDMLIEPLLHLLKNAVVHGIETTETRRLIGKAECGRIVVKVKADDEALLISIIDDGSGISPARLREKAVRSGIITLHQADSMNDRDAVQLIFDRGLTTAEKVDMNAGRGIGMSIVKEAVERRGGSIVVESEPQRGTTFTILIPTVEPKKETSVESADGTDQTPLVLVVDDSASVRRQTTNLVEKAGLKVITANNGAEALELLLNGDWEPDLILSDVEMPQIDGWGLLEYVKTDTNFGHIPVVMVTSLDAETHRVRAAELGAADYLIKPLSGTDLSRILDTVIYN